MNKFLVVLKCNMNDDIRRYFEKRGVEVYFHDELLPDVFFCNTSLSLEEIAELDYVFDIKPPRTGTLLEK